MFVAHPAETKAGGTKYVSAFRSKIGALSQVKAATPRLYASGFLSSGTQSAGAKITGIDPLSPASDPYREGIISGSYLSPDDRDAVLIGKPMAEKLKLKVGDNVSLSLNTADGNVEEQTFTVSGIYTTDTYGFDSHYAPAAGESTGDDTNTKITPAQCMCC